MDVSETVATLDEVEPQTWLTDVLERMVSGQGGRMKSALSIRAG